MGGSEHIAGIDIVSDSTVRQGWNLIGSTLGCAVCWQLLAAVMVNTFMLWWCTAQQAGPAGAQGDGAKGRWPLVRIICAVDVAAVRVRAQADGACVTAACDGLLHGIALTCMCWHACVYIMEGNLEACTGSVSCPGGCREA